MVVQTFPVVGRAPGWASGVGEINDNSDANMTSCLSEFFSFSLAELEMTSTEVEGSLDKAFTCGFLDCQSGYKISCRCAPRSCGAQLWSVKLTIQRK